MKILLAPAMALALLPLFGLTGCVPQPNVQAEASAQSAAEAAPPVQHNLSRVGVAKAVTPEMRATLKVGQTTRVQLVEMLGEIKPFSLGDGKKIYRYDVGEFFFDAKGVLLRQHLTP